MLWLWSSPRASAALRSRQLGVILRAYRAINRLSQEQLAQLLGYDKTYISMIETRRRTISEVGTLRHIAHTLAIPVHVLGASEPDDATYLAMVQFADSILNLAEIARQTGRAADAVGELWPLVARLEARASEGLADRDTLALLGRARGALGVALGTVLPEEKLPSAARWTGQALVVVSRLAGADPDTQPLTHALAMHGNELRKAGHLGAAIVRLRDGLTLALHRPAAYGLRIAVAAMLARAAGEAADAGLFDTTFDLYRRLLDDAPPEAEQSERDMFANSFTAREIQIRGLTGTGRAATAARLMDRPQFGRPAAPQWAVINQVTTGEVLLAIGDRHAAGQALIRSIASAEAHRLPHQIQRALRLAVPELPEVTAAGRAALRCLDHQLD